VRVDLPVSFFLSFLCSLMSFASLTRRQRMAVRSVLASMVVLLCWASPTATYAQDTVRSYLEGQLTVDPEIDDSGTYAGFDVLVVQDVQGAPDTLGIATTDADGAFAVTIEAPRRGLYPLVVTRGGRIVLAHELVVADGDSARLTAQLPAASQSVRVRSPENAAWMAYQNTQALHQQSLLESLQGEGTDDELEQSIQRTASMLWQLRTSFPGTVGAEIAAAESVAMLEGWDDALALERGREIEPSAPGFVDVARAMRSATARLDGQDAAIALLDDLIARTDAPDRSAALYAERVRARVDSLQRDEALAAMEALKAAHPDSRWATWADRILYQLDNLSPGAPAPAGTVRTLSGESLALSDLEGSLVLLEFFAPQSSVYRRELPLRTALYDAAKAADQGFEIVSVSLEPDEVLNATVFEEFDLGGILAVAPEGVDDPLAAAYNVTSVPTRYLIAPDGTIVDVYYDGAMLAVQEAVAQRLALDSLAPAGPPENGTEPEAPSDDRP